MVITSSGVPADRWGEDDLSAGKRQFNEMMQWAANENVYVGSEKRKTTTSRNAAVTLQLLGIFRSEDEDDYEYEFSVQGPVSRKPRNFFGPVKP